MKRWIELCSDVNWVDYHGMWARRARDGSWYVIRWTNMYDACGEGECKRDGCAQFNCSLVRLDLNDLTDKQVASALQSCGWQLEPSGEIISESGDHVAGPGNADPVLVECCVQYGFGAPIYDESSDKYPERLRARVRRYAETCMRDAPLLATRLARTVNKIGSTAAEYGKGDLDSALHRGPFDTAKNIIRKMHGLPPEIGGN